MMERFNSRERLFLTVGAIAVAATLLWLGVVSPYADAVSRLDARIDSQTKQLKEVRDLTARYSGTQAALTLAERRLGAARDFSLLPFVESLGDRFAKRENLVSMRPRPTETREGFREEGVEVRLEKLQLEQLVRLLHAVDSAEALLKVQTMRIKPRFDDHNLIDATMTLAWYRN